MTAKRTPIPKPTPALTPDRGDDWRESSACKGAGRDGASPWDYDATPADHAHAMTVCLNSCPVIDRCGQFARTHRPDGGVWAGVLHPTRSS